MIATPQGWSRRYAGRDVLMFPPQGPARGGLRYSERLAPLRPIATLVEEHLADSAFATDKLGPVERLTTAEGEQAALVTVSGTVDGRPAQKDLGFVLLDGEYARTSVLALCPEDFARFPRMVRELVQADCHLAGERRRWFEYQRPADWQARARGFQADWYPLDFPRAFGVLCVWPALPVRARSVISELLAPTDAGNGWQAVEISDATWVSSSHGLSGKEWRLSGRVGDRLIRRLVAVLEDRRYLYPLRMETQHVAHEEIFAKVVRSVRPVPLASAVEVAEAPAHVAQWVD